MSAVSLHILTTTVTQQPVPRIDDTSPKEREKILFNCVRGKKEEED